MTLASWLFHRICVADASTPSGGGDDGGRDDASAIRFFERFGASLDVSDKTVLDVGCGAGSLCFEAARRGARRVVGIDLQLVGVARRRLESEHPDLADRVELVETDGSLAELGAQEFDVVLSKDSFEHYPEPERFVHVLARCLSPGGRLVVGFGPLWMAPGGGHIGYMTKVPWAHLLFPERVILAERRRFRPDEHAERFEDIVGGLNKITYRRFESLMAGSGLECVELRRNVSDHPAVKAMDVLSHIPPLRELFVNNVYTIWRKPDLVEAGR